MALGSRLPGFSAVPQENQGPERSIPGFAVEPPEDKAGNEACWAPLWTMEFLEVAPEILCF